MCRPYLLVGAVSVACVWNSAESTLVNHRQAADVPVTPTPTTLAWIKQHERFVCMARRGDIDLLFLGDSITESWGGEGHDISSPGHAIFIKEFAPLRAANFGIGGDCTQHLLWRLQHGELDGVEPKVIVLLVGSNNVWAHSAEEIARGITAIVHEIRNHCRSTRILLLGIFPCGEKPNRQRDTLNRVNILVANLDDGGKTIKYLDLKPSLVSSDGTIDRELMPDFLHLSKKGYQIWADAIKEPILELFKKQRTG